MAGIHDQKCLGSNILDYMWMTAFVSNDFQMLDRLWKQSSLSTESAAVYFLTVCEEGSLKVAQWLDQTVDLSEKIYYFVEEEKMSIFPMAFVKACKGGHLAIAQWLLERKALHRDALKLMHYAFWAAFSNNHLKVIKWLMERFDICPSNLKAKEYIYTHFSLACAKGNLAALKWLHTELQLPLSKDRRTIAIGLRSAFEAGQTNVVEWILATFRKSSGERQFGEEKCAIVS